jgi:hypothetical protein
MSILAKPEPVQKTAAEIAAENVASNIRSLAELIASQWRNCYREVWENENATPAEILAAFGENGGEVFEFSTAIIELIAGKCSERRPDLVEGIMTRAAMIPPVTIAEDGTVTIDPEPEPEPEEPTEE